MADMLGNISHFIGEGAGILGEVARTVVEIGVQKTAEATVSVVGAGVDITMGKERGKRIASGPIRLLVDQFGDVDGIIETATHVIDKASPAPLGKLVTAVLSRFPSLISLELLLSTTRTLAATILNAFIANVGQLQIVRDGIFSNQLNSATLGLVWNNAADLANFFVDLAESIKCYASADSLNGVVPQNNPHASDNEFDFSKAMNRHAFISQVQRLAKSIILILQKVAVQTQFEDIDMTSHTTLKSDSYKPGTIIEVKPSGSQRVVQAWRKPYYQPAGDPIPPSPIDEQLEWSAPTDKQLESKVKATTEKWLFINGVAGELFWLHIACKRLAKQYSRDITGVFNRGDGILWDLVECAGERSAQGTGTTRSQGELIRRTTSSRNAQAALKKELQNALSNVSNGEPKRIIMIAHSQGCLHLRLVLEEILKEAFTVSNETLRRTMLDRLCVFTFGNPSVDWKLGGHGQFPAQPLPNSKQTQPNLDFFNLSAHVLRTEHFVNDKDFVAKLGALSDNSPQNRGYANDCVFINTEEDWIGHLFGTQYSLDPAHYRNRQGLLNGNNSWLLACQNGSPMR